MQKRDAIGAMDAWQQPIVTNDSWLGLGAEQFVEYS